MLIRYWQNRADTDTSIGASLVYLFTHTYVLIGEHLKNEEFAKTSPFKMLPSMDDNGFYLFER